MSTFGFFSDLHNSKYYFTNIMNDLFTLTDGGKELDGLILVGDIVYHEQKDIPSADSYALINSSPWFKELKENGKLVFCMGNHEFTLFATDGEKCRQARLAFSMGTGLEPEADTVLCGYHFITAGPKTYNGELSEEQEKWVTDTVTNALADGSEKPVFLMLHQPVDNTLYGTYNGNAYSDEFEAFVKAQPRLIVVSGHTHYPSSDPQSIYQVPGGATFIYTSSVMGGNGVFLPYATERHVRYPSQGLIMNINDNTNVVTVKRFYVSENDPEYLEGGDWTLDIPAMIRDSKNTCHDIKTVYKYTNARKDLSAQPYFADGAVLTVGRVTDSSATVSFPAALQGAEGENSVVAYYKIELYSDADTPEITHKIPTDFFLPSKREIYNYTFFDLPSSAKRRVTVTPITAWYVEGKNTLTAEFSTTEPRFAEVAFAEMYEKEISDAEIEGKHTSYTTLIHIADSWVTDVIYRISIGKAGTYRFSLTGSAEDAASVVLEAEGVSEEVVINTGSIFSFRDIICADVEFRTAGEYTVKLRKNVTPCTVGLKGIKYGLISE